MSDQDYITGLERARDELQAEVERLRARVAYLESVITQDGGAADWQAEVERLRGVIRNEYEPLLQRLRAALERCVDGFDHGFHRLAVKEAREVLGRAASEDEA